MKRPLIIVSGLSLEQAQQLEPVLERLKRPVWLEATSQLREASSLRDLVIQGGEKTLVGLEIDGIIRIGGVPTLRFWRDLEKSSLEVWNYSSRGLSGLPRASHNSSFEEIFGMNWSFEEWSDQEQKMDRERAKKKTELLAELPLSEPGWFAQLSRQIPSAARVFLGNSLPIREWDLAADFARSREFFANRGANGIDGLISTFCGLCDPGKSNWAVLGDLSTLYDLSGPWALNERPISDWNLIVINNSGGQIFSRMFKHQLFLNTHQLEFSSWAKMWGLRYHCVSEPGQFPASGAPQVLEVIPNQEQTKIFWEKWERL